MRLPALPNLFAPARTVTGRFSRIGWGLTLIYVAIALLCPLLQSWGWLQDPGEALLNPIHQPPSWEHWFGTTRQGYDVFTRTLFGTRVALLVVVLGTGLSLLVGVPLGMVSGYFGGPVDRLLVFLMDTLYTLPGLLLSVTLAFVVGRGIPNAAIALAIAYVPQYFRLVRSQTLSVRNEVYVEAAQALGASPLHILRRYLFGNVVQSIPVLFTINAADAVLILGSLGFLGLGIPEDIPEWGYDLKQALAALPTGIWWTALFPGLAMTGLVVALSLLGEGLSEALQPQRQ